MGEGTSLLLREVREGGREGWEGGREGGKALGDPFKSERSTSYPPDSHVHAQMVLHVGFAVKY